MSDFDTIKTMLEKVYSNPKTRPYEIWERNKRIFLEFIQSDEYYNTSLVFDKTGKFITIN